MLCPRLFSAPVLLAATGLAAGFDPGAAAAVTSTGDFKPAVGVKPDGSVKFGSGAGAGREAGS